MDANLFIIFVFVFALVAMNRWFKLQRERVRGASPADQVALDRALDHARRLEERIESLERVLDEDMPGWRRKVSA
jgi:phage shock protein B